jgi:hypothetical protein
MANHTISAAVIASVAILPTEMGENMRPEFQCAAASSFDNKPRRIISALICPGGQPISL